MNNSNLVITSRLIRMKEVLKICGMSRTSLYREVKAQKFPSPVKLSARSVAWLENEVNEWINARTSLRASRKSAKPAN